MISKQILLVVRDGTIWIFSSSVYLGSSECFLARNSLAVHLLVVIFHQPVGDKFSPELFVFALRGV